MTALHELYIVREPFKAGGVLFPAGKVLTEAEVHQVRLFKVRLNEGKIVPLKKYSQTELLNLIRYLDIRYGVDAKAAITDKLSKGSGSAETTKASATTPTGTKPAPKSGVTPVAKVATKPATKQTK